LGVDLEAVVKAGGSVGVGSVEEGSVAEEMEGVGLVVEDLVVEGLVEGLLQHWVCIVI